MTGNASAPVPRKLPVSARESPKLKMESYDDVSDPDPAADNVVRSEKTIKKLTVFFMVYVCRGWREKYYMICIRLSLIHI